MTTTKPRRLQRKRTAGFDLRKTCTNPLGYIYVGRPTTWGNPYPRDRDMVRFRQYCERSIRLDPDWLKPLRGRDLVCWCKVGDMCHADILLELANGEL